MLEQNALNSLVNGFGTSLLALAEDTVSLKEKLQCLVWFPQFPVGTTDPVASPSNVLVMLAQAVPLNHEGFLDMSESSSNVVTLPDQVMAGLDQFFGFVELSLLGRRAACR